MKTNKFVHISNLKAGIYPLPEPELPDTKTSMPSHISEPKIDMWHKRLGNVSADCVNKAGELINKVPLFMM